MPFLVLQSVCFALGPFATAFESRYRPALFTFPSGNLCTAAVMPGLCSSAPVSQAAALLEGALWAFCQLLPTPPRSLNPKQEAFWIVQYLFEQLYKLVSTLLLKSVLFAINSDACRPPKDQASVLLLIGRSFVWRNS